METREDKDFRNRYAMRLFNKMKTLINEKIPENSDVKFISNSKKYVNFYVQIDHTIYRDKILLLKNMKEFIFVDDIGGKNWRGLCKIKL